jgi:hypothetical protein
VGLQGDATRGGTIPATHPPPRVLRIQRSAICCHRFSNPEIVQLPKSGAVQRMSSRDLDRQASIQCALGCDDNQPAGIDRRFFGWRFSELVLAACLVALFENRSTRSPPIGVIVHHRFLAWAVMDTEHPCLLILSSPGDVRLHRSGKEPVFCVAGRCQPELDHQGDPE